MSASWPDADAQNKTLHTNEAVIWDTIITSPTADHLQNIGPAAMKKLRRSAKGKAVDPSRYVGFRIGFAVAKILIGWNRGKLELKNQKAKYQITAPTGKLAEVENVVLKVHYNVQPWVGVLTWTPQVNFGRWKLVKGGVSKPFKLPAVKTKEEKKTTEKKKTGQKA